MVAGAAFSFLVLVGLLGMREAKPCCALLGALTLHTDLFWGPLRPLKQKESYSLVLRPKTSGIPEAMVYGILMFMRLFGPPCLAVRNEHHLRCMVTCCSAIFSDEEPDVGAAAAKAQPCSEISFGIKDTRQHPLSNNSPADAGSLPVASNLTVVVKELIELMTRVLTS